MKRHERNPRRRLWMRLFAHSAILILVFALALTAANAALLTRFFVWREKRILRESADAVMQIDLNDLTQASQRLQAIEADRNLQIIIYSQNAVIYSTLGRSFLQRPGVSGFDFLFGSRLRLEVLSREEDGESSVIERAVNRDDGMRYLVYRRAGADYTVELTVQENLLENSAQTASRFMLIIAGICLLGAVGWSILYARRFARPVSEMNEIAVAMSHLDFSRRLEPSSDDEIGHLAVSINELSASLDRALRELGEKNERLRSDLELERRMDQMRREFVANVSHELKTPISIIQGYAEGLSQDLESPEKREKYCAVIREESERMNRLVLRLLELSRLESGRKPELAAFDLCALLIRLADKNAVAFEKKGIVPALELPDRCPVCADAALIEHALQNYLSNALSHVPDGGEIRLTCEPREGVVLVTVCNSGSQIAPEELERIWQPFYRGDASHNRSAGRCGLGLSIVRAVAQAHGTRCGCCNLPAAADGAPGVCFWLEIPSAAPPDASALPAPAK